MNLFLTRSNLLVDSQKGHKDALLAVKRTDSGTKAPPEEINGGYGEGAQPPCLSSGPNSDRCEPAQTGAPGGVISRTESGSRDRVNILKVNSFVLIIKEARDPRCLRGLGDQGRTNCCLVEKQQ